MGNKVENRIKNVMSAVFDIPISEIDDESSPDKIESWDSLKHINMVIALEDEFGIQFSDDNIIELINVKLINLVVRDILSTNS